MECVGGKDVALSKDGCRLWEDRFEEPAWLVGLDVSEDDDVLRSEVLEEYCVRSCDRHVKHWSEA